MRGWGTGSPPAAQRLLLHIVDVAPFGRSVDSGGARPGHRAGTQKYDEALYNKPRWLVLNKLDSWWRRTSDLQPWSRNL